jgi:hypothetical protein
MKRYSQILFDMVLALAILASCAPPKGGTTADTIAAPAQADDIQKISGYVDRLVAEGLSEYVQISAEDGKPYIFIMRPATDEITDGEIGNIGRLALHAAAFFRSHKEFHEEEINISFQRPQEHRIALIKRENALEIGGQARGEISLIVGQGNVVSIVNLAGPKKNGRQDYANAWSAIQAICLAFAINIEDSDPICNIISANAAAGWTGIGRSEAEQMITAYGSTRLEYLGNQDYQYRFIPSIYDSFKPE